EVSPVWHPAEGQPRVSAFRISVPVATGADGGVMSRQVPTTYLRGCAQRSSAALVEQGLLKTGEVFRYVVSAFAATGTVRPPAANGIDFAVEETLQRLPLTETPLKGLLCRAARTAAEHVTGDFPVFIPRTVFAEATELAQAAGDVETGGVLVGLLHHDP